MISGRAALIAVAGSLVLAANPSLSVTVANTGYRPLK